MTYDERDPRDLSREQPDEVSPEEEQGEADEFETASWPAQDSQPPRSTFEPDGGEPDEGEPEPPDASRPAEPAAADSQAEWPAPDAAWPAPDAAWPAREPAAPEPETAAPGPETAEPEPEAARPEPEAVWPDGEAGDSPPPEAEAYAATGEATEPALPAHSVPATEPGEGTRCPRCGTENRPGIAFCRNCGQRLVAAGAPTTVERPAAPDGTQACPRCGTHNRAGVAFCQNCGANLRVAETGYVPPAVSPAGPRAEAHEGGRALLGPIVLLIGAIGVAVAWLLPFPFGDEGSLYDRAVSAPDAYGIAFWSAYDAISDVAQQAYFGFAAPSPLLVALLVVLAVAGFLRPAPAILQWIGLAVALIWAIGLAILFVVVEVLGGGGGGLIDILRALTPGGIIFMLASLIVVIGALTRFGRG